MLASPGQQILVLLIPHQKASYLTLSHCWGGLEQTTLTLDKGVTYQERIAISTLFTTVQDAIQVTRRLGVRYLWVDSLCKVQDSRPDWERKSALMDLFYSNSFCTIAAVPAEDDRSGCFTDRNPQEIVPRSIPNPFYLHSKMTFFL